MYQTFESVFMITITVYQTPQTLAKPFSPRTPILIHVCVSITDLSPFSSDWGSSQLQQLVVK